VPRRGAIDAVFLPPATAYHPELLIDGLEPHTVKEVYLSGSAHPDRWVDISEVFETKLKAIRCHVSQVKDPEAMVKRVTDRQKQ
jgi:LmbE family N-acetylglucosaminyl deacetylase